MNNAIEFGRENTQGQKSSESSLSSRTKTFTSEVRFLVNNPILFLVQILILILKNPPPFFIFS